MTGKRQMRTAQRCSATVSDRLCHHKKRGCVRGNPHTPLRYVIDYRPLCCWASKRRSFALSLWRRPVPAPDGNELDDCCSPTLSLSGIFL